MEYCKRLLNQFNDWSLIILSTYLLAFRKADATASVFVAAIADDTTSSNYDFFQPIFGERAGSKCERIYILQLCVSDIGKPVTTSEMDEDYFHKIEQPQFFGSFLFQNYRIYLSSPRTSPLTRKVGVAYNPTPHGTQKKVFSLLLCLGFVPSNN